MLLLTALIWGVAFVAQSVGLDYVGPFTFNGSRFIMGGIVLIPCMFYLHFVSGRKEEGEQGTGEKITKQRAAEKAVQMDSVVEDIQSAVADFSQAVKGQQNLVGAVSNLVKAFGTLAAIFHKESEEEDKKKKKSK